MSEPSGMKILLGLFAVTLVSAPCFGQMAGGGLVQGRVGGISYVTRRLPMAGAGGQAAALFSAGGVSGMTAGSAGTVGVNSGSAVIAQRPNPDSNVRALAALRHLAAAGDKDAQRVLRNQSLAAQLANTR